MVQELSREPTPEEVAQKLRLSPEKVEEILKIAQDPVSLETPVGDEASAGGGVVTAQVNGKHEVVSLTIAPDAVDPEDVEMLQDLVIAAAVSYTHLVPA